MINLVFGLSFLVLTIWLICLHVRIESHQREIDRNTARTEVLSSLNYTVTNALSRLNGVELGIQEISEIRAQLRFIQRQIQGEPEVIEDGELPEDYDEIPETNHHADPGGTTIESLMRSR